jgi:hypothetical protein
MLLVEVFEKIGIFLLEISPVSIAIFVRMDALHNRLCKCNLTSSGLDYKCFTIINYDSKISLQFTAYLVIIIYSLSEG